MSLRLLVFAGLRIYAIYFATQVLAAIPFLVQEIYLRNMPEEEGTTRVVSSLLPVLGMLIVAILLWLLAGRLAAGVIRDPSPAIDKFALTLEDAYVLAFVFLGLDFVLGSLGGFLQQLYYLVAVVAQAPDSSPERSQAFFQIYRPGITLIAGFAALLGARFWARKLVAFGTTTVA